MNYSKKYKTEVLKRIKSLDEIPLLTIDDIQSLPIPVQKYLAYVGAIGKPKVKNVRVDWTGRMKRNRKSGWMNISCQQFNFFEEPSRFFYIRSKMFGIPFDGLHIYSGNTATMQIKVASIFQVVDAKGEKMSKGETVTGLNDMCVLAPSTLINPDIRWETMDPLRVKATFTNERIMVSAMLEFNEKGELINFISEDRYYCEDGKTYLSYPWSTPVGNYIEINGRKLPSYGEAIWHMEEGEFSYAQFDLEKVDYNCDKGPDSFLH